MSSKNKRTSKNPLVKETSKQARTMAESEASSSTTPVPSTPAVRESITPPSPEVCCKTVSDILNTLKPLAETSDQSITSYPVIIGSRAAAYWLPSFRPFSDWDLIATPQQAFNMVKDLEAYEDKKKNPLKISLIRQPLDGNIVRRRPMTPEIKEKIDSLPFCLYKICGELKDVIKFEIEVVPVSSQTKAKVGNSSKKKKFHDNCSPSAAQLLSICNAIDSKNRAYLNFSISPNNEHKCLIAPIEVLEALKVSHINWPAYFPKHIADLHSLRALMYTSPSSSPLVNMGIYADKNKPLTGPARTPELEDFLFTRTIETEAFRGTPGAHINLDVSNEDFLGRDDDLFVTRFIPHDDVHEIVKYGKTPIYDQLKTDKSKAMVSRELFEKAPYDKQIKCVKEEAMVISLERFLLPGISTDPTSAYKSALIRICTTLTKGWFRQFAVDNYPRLVICDKSLLPIRDDILKKHPLPPKTRGDPLCILKKTITDLDDLVIVQKLIPLTKPTDFFEVRQLMIKDTTTKERALQDDVDYDSEYDSNDDEREAYIKYAKINEDFWIIHSCAQNQPPLLISFINESYFDHESCCPSSHFHGTLSVQLINSDTDFKNLRAYTYDEFGYCAPSRNKIGFHKVATTVSATTAGGSWGGSDIWSRKKITAQSLKQEVSVLGLEGLTEDLLMKYILSVVQPKLSSNGETPLVNRVNALKSSGALPFTPKNHLWYDLWKSNMNK